MGMANAFGNNANFSRIIDQSSNGNPGLRLSKALQKVVIDVNEYGIGTATLALGIHMNESLITDAVY